jgi:hypothetical protein
VEVQVLSPTPSNPLVSGLGGLFVGSDGHLPDAPLLLEFLPRLPNGTALSGSISARDLLTQAVTRDWINEPAVGNQAQLDPHRSRHLTCIGPAEDDELNELEAARPPTHRTTADMIPRNGAHNRPAAALPTGDRPARGSLDRHATYIVATYLAGATR